MPLLVINNVPDTLSTELSNPLHNKKRFLDTLFTYVTSQPLKVDNIHYSQTMLEVWRIEPMPLLIIYDEPDTLPTELSNPLHNKNVFLNTLFTYVTSQLLKVDKIHYIITLLECGGLNLCH